MAAAPVTHEPASSGHIPSLLESLAGKVDLSDAPIITGTDLPPMTGPDDKVKQSPDTPEKPPEKKDEPPKEEKPKEPIKKTDEELEEEWKKSSEAISEKLFGKKKKTETKKPEEQKPKEPEPSETTKADDKPKPKPRAARPALDEASITERAAAAASEAATKAVTAAVAKAGAGTGKSEQIQKSPEDSLTDDERRQYAVYQEIESLYPSKYKGITKNYLKSLGEIQTYIKDWAKDNPGNKFNPDEPEHDDFFKRVEPQVDEDDYIDAKAAIRAREFAKKAVEPIQEQVKQMERERARQILEPFIREKQLEAVHSMLQNFDPEIATELRKPDGLAALHEKDPITADILNRTADMIGNISAEVIRLHDQAAGVPYDPKNEMHREIADFIVAQENRISRLPASDKLRDGKMFISRLQYQQLPTEEKGRYWFLNQDDVIFMLSQKYGAQAKKLRDEQIEKFNATAEKLGYKRASAPAKETTKNGQTQKPTTNNAPKVVSPEATGGSRMNPSSQTPLKENTDFASAIVSKLFPHRL